MTKEETKRRREERRLQAEQNAVVRKADEDLVLETVRGILRDDRATPVEKLFSICIMDNMRYYHLCPHDVPFLDKPKDDVLARLRERFKAELAESQTATISDR